MVSFKVNKDLLPMKAFYFFWNAGTAPVVSYMTVYARQLNFSSTEVGIIYTIAPILTLIVKPITGALADKYKCQKLIFMVSQILTILSICAIIFLPKDPTPVTEEYKFTVKCGASYDFRAEMCNFDQRFLTAPSDIKSCDYSCYAFENNGTNFLDYRCHQLDNLDILEKTGSIRSECIRTNQPLVCDVKCTSKVLTKETSKSSYSRYYFWVLLGVYLFDFFGRAATIIFGDAICFQLLGDAPHKYGYQRMYGALGWGIVSLYTGYMIDALSTDPEEKNYVAVFWMGAAILGLCTLSSYFIRFDQVESSATMLKDVKNIFGNFRAFVFILWSLFVGTFVAIERNFLFYFIDDLADAQGPESVAQVKTIEGIAMAVGCLAGELPFFFISGWILQRIKHVHVMSIILLVSGGRFIITSYLVDPWWIVPMQLINGWTFGIFYSTLASYTSMISTPATKATAQGFIGALYEGAGSALGALIGGFLYDDYGGAQIFRIYGFVILICFVLHVGTHFIKRETSEYKGQSTDNLTEDIPIEKTV